MAQYIFEGKYQNKSTNVEVKLLLFHFEDENKVHFIYSPHLDLTGYGNNFEEARKSFEIVFEDFVDYTLKKRTLGKVLADLGWELKGLEKTQKAGVVMRNGQSPAWIGQLLYKRISTRSLNLL